MPISIFKLENGSIILLLLLSSISIWISDCSTQTIIQKTPCLNHLHDEKTHELII